MKKILIIEDDIKIREELCKFLKQNGYDCDYIEDFDRAIDIAKSDEYDLILLDINLPVYDGFYICREIRREKDVPIIVVTSKNTDMDELMAMNFGADDFVSKPYNTQILLARIASVLRRSTKGVSNNRIDCGRFFINLNRSTFEHENTEYELTKNEMKILSILLQKKNQIVSRDDLMTHLWDSDVFVDDNTLTVNVNRLRKKFASAGLDNVIQTKRGRGYIFI